MRSKLEDLVFHIDDLVGERITKIHTPTIADGKREDSALAPLDGLGHEHRILAFASVDQKFLEEMTRLKVNLA